MNTFGVYLRAYIEAHDDARNNRLPSQQNHLDAVEDCALELLDEYVTDHLVEKP